MNRSTLIATSMAVMTLIATTLSSGQVPQLISYQGQLNDQNGLPVNATVSIQFSIYDTDVGGSPLWTENQSVQVSNGVFSVQLGSVETFPRALFVADVLYLGVRVGADQEMEPRQQITSSGYAQRAEITTPPQISGARVLDYSVSQNATNFEYHTAGTVPVGKKWLITTVSVIHESDDATSNLWTMVRLGETPVLGVASRAGTEYLTRTARLTWNFDAAPVLSAGEVVEVGAAVGRTRLAAANITYVEVPDSFPTREVILLSASRSSDGWSTLGTVPSGKKWRVVSLAMASAHGDYLGNVRYTLNLGGTVALRGGANGADPFGGQFDTATFPYDQAPVLSEGEVIEFALSHNLSAQAWAVVVEE